MEFLLEWFLKSLLPYIGKDVSTSRVQNEEQAIFRAHELDLIYAQSGLLYEIIPNAPFLVSTPKLILDHMPMELWVVQVPKPMDSVVKQVSQFSINQYALGQATTLSQPTQMVSVIFV